MGSCPSADIARSPYLKLLEIALTHIRQARERYVDADPYVKRLLNQIILEKIEVKNRQLVSVELKELFYGLFLIGRFK